MDGNEEYGLLFERKITKIIEYKPELYGFYAFMYDSELTTIYNYMRTIAAFLETVNKSPGKLRMDDFTYYLTISRKTKKGKRTSNSYRITVYHALKRYAEYLVESQVLKSDPMAKVKRPSAKEQQETIEKRAKGYLTEDEIKLYLDTVKNGCSNQQRYRREEAWQLRDHAIILIFLSTGIRCSAMYKLDIDSIDWERGVLFVTDKGADVKDYELTPEVKAALVKWLTAREHIVNGQQTDALFVSERKTRITNQGIAYIIKKYAENIAGKNITPHKLRATYGTQLYNETKDIYFVQKAMGHANPKTTELYVRGQNDQTAKAADIMSKFLK